MHDTVPRKTFMQSLENTYYRRLVVYIAIVVTLIFLTQIAQVLYG